MQTHIVVAVKSGKRVAPCVIMKAVDSFIEDYYQRSKLETVEDSAGGKPDSNSG